MTNIETLDILIPEGRQKQLTYKQVFCNLSELVIPNITTAFIQSLTDFLPYYFIGLLSQVDKIGAIGIAITWFNIAAYSIILGCSSTIDTLVSQSFGQKKYKSCATHYFRGCIIVFLISIPLAFFVYFGGFFLAILGVNKHIADSAGKYLALLIPNLFLIGQYELLKKFLNAQYIVNPTTVVTIITTILHPLWCYLCIFHVFDSSYLGAALAKNLTTLLSLLLLMGYVNYTGCCKETTDFDTNELGKGISEWISFIKLAIPSTLMIGLDWWAYEIMNIMAGNIGTTGLSANVALTNINMLIFMIPTGIGISAGAFVGNCIGSQDIPSAKKYTSVATTMSCVIMYTLLGILLLCRKYVAYFFFPKSGSKEVIDLFEKVIFILALSELFDTTQGCLARILVGMKKQTAATLGIIISYYGVMIPFGLLLVFKLKYGLYGLWVANTLAAFSLAAIYVWIIMFANWDLLVLDAVNEAKQISN